MGRSPAAGSEEMGRSPAAIHLMGSSSPDVAESCFRELDVAFLQKQTRIWLGEVLHLRFDEERPVSDLLADGELLFQVSRAIWKMLLKKYADLRHSKHLIYERTSSGKSEGRYMPYPKVDSFLKICQILGLTGIDMFSPSDVVEKKDIRRVCMCIRSLSKRARSKDLNVPDFDIVTYTITMPTHMVGGIRRNLELSNSNSSCSSGGSPGMDGREIYQKVSSEAHYVQCDDQTAGFDKAECYHNESKFQSPPSNASYEDGRISNTFELTSPESSPLGNAILCLESEFHLDSKKQMECSYTRECDMETLSTDLNYLQPDDDQEFSISSDFQYEKVQHAILSKEINAGSISSILWNMDTKNEFLACPSSDGYVSSSPMHVNDCINDSGMQSFQISVECKDCIDTLDTKLTNILTTPVVEPTDSNNKVERGSASLEGGVVPLGQTDDIITGHHKGCATLSAIVGRHSEDETTCIISPSACPSPRGIFADARNIVPEDLNAESKYISFVIPHTLQHAQGDISFLENIISCSSTNKNIASGDFERDNVKIQPFVVDCGDNVIEKANLNFGSYEQCRDVIVDMVKEVSEEFCGDSTINCSCQQNSYCTNISESDAKEEKSPKAKGLKYTDKASIKTMQKGYMEDHSDLSKPFKHCVDHDSPIKDIHVVHTDTQHHSCAHETVAVYNLEGAKFEDKNLATPPSIHACIEEKERSTTNYDQFLPYSSDLDANMFHNKADDSKNLRNVSDGNGISNARGEVQRRNHVVLRSVAGAMTLVGSVLLFLHLRRRDKGRTLGSSLYQEPEDNSSVGQVKSAISDEPVHLNRGPNSQKSRKDGSINTQGVHKSGAIYPGARLNF